MKKISFIYLIFFLCIPAIAVSTEFGQTQTATFVDNSLSETMQAENMQMEAEQIPKKIAFGQMNLKSSRDNELFHLLDAGNNSSDTANSSPITFMILLTVGILGFVGIRRKRP